MLRELPVFVATLGLACAVCCAQAPTSPDEKSLWFLWQHQQDKPDDHSGLVVACEEFKKKAPHDPLVVVSEGIAAWHLLKAGETNSATRILQPMLTAQPDLSATDPLREAAADIARTWLTRIDLEQVKWALQKLYRQEVEYPESLDAIRSLPKDEQPPFADRWGKPWSYRLVGFRRLKGFLNQKYELQSSMLGRTSDISQALDIPYASRINLRPVKLVLSTRGKETVEFVSTNEKKENVYLSVGTKLGDIFFAHMGKRILVLSDGNHWIVLPRPK